MNRMKVFGIRNMKEFLRDPLSYIFCLGFPVVMLIIMTIVNNSIPPEAGMDIFTIKKLAAGIAVFGLTFMMLFTAIGVSKDRTCSFLIRLYATPMKSADFMGGYIFPMLLIGLAQAFIAFAISYVIGIIQDTPFQIGYMLLALITLILPIVMFIGFGLLFGSFLSEKGAPGICSIIISVASMLGGIYMDVETMGGTFFKICKVLPFYHCVNATRGVLAGNYDQVGSSLLVVLIYTVVLVGSAILVFGKKMKADLN